MKIVFSLEGCIPFSINDMTTISYNKKIRKPMFTRSRSCRDWGDTILSQMQKSDIKARLLSFKESINPNKTHGLLVKLTFVMPNSKLYTKKGNINKFSKDLTNVEKPLIDLLFDKRIDGRTLNNKVVRNLALDDKYIVELISQKRPSKDEKFRILVEIEELDTPLSCV